MATIDLRLVSVSLVMLTAASFAQEYCPAYPGYFSERTDLSKAWSETKKDAAAANIPIPVADEVVALGLSHTSESARSDQSSYLHQIVIDNRMSGAPQLAAVCGVASCYLAKTGVPSDVVNDFNYLCFGGDPSNRNRIKINDPLRKLSVTPSQMGTTRRVELSLTGSPDATLTATLASPDSAITASATRIPQHAPKVPFDLNVKIPILKRGQMMSYPFRIEFKESATVLLGAIEIRRSDDNECDQWDSEGKFCNVCTRKVVRNGLHVNDNDRLSCPNMKPGSFVDIKFNAAFKVGAPSGLFQGVLKVVPINNEVESVHDGEMMNSPAIHNPSTLTPNAAVTVPEHAGAWGDSGTVAVKWLVDRCVTNPGAPNKIVESTCDIDGTLTFTVRR